MSKRASGFIMRFFNASREVVTRWPRGRMPNQPIIGLATNKTCAQMKNPAIAMYRFNARLFLIDPLISTPSLLKSNGCEKTASPILSKAAYVKNSFKFIGSLFCTKWLIQSRRRLMFLSKCSSELSKLGSEYPALNCLERCTFSFGSSVD